jgi:hypothetical protein
MFIAHSTGDMYVRSMIHNHTGDNWQPWRQISGNGTNATYAEYASTDTSKGTIEERLTNLGFKESSIDLYTSGGSRVGSVGLKRQGNYVIADFSINSSTSTKWNGKIGTLPENFRPINDQEYFIGGIGVSATGENISISFTLKVYNTGEINIPSIPTASLQYSTVSLGFEAPRI